MTKATTPPQGYKQTKIGVLPVDWDAVRLKKLILKFESGVSVNGENRPLEKGEIGVLKVSAVSYGVFNSTAAKAVIEDDLDRVRTNPKKGQIIISRANTPELVGASAFVHDDYPDLYLPDKLWQTVTDEKVVDNRYLFATLQSSRVKERTKNLATGSSGSMKNISKPSFLSIQIPLPPLPEQQKIAKTLSTWDEAIRLQTQLINAKQEQKRGLMQNLLLGEIQLSGFQDNWVVTSLSSYFDER
ncbi:MAG: restriction endonuclease subunit S, partial [Bacteroidota bacterium]